ncbi:MAG TPA: alpha/beta hydrolase-fold protein [Caulobacteraceae bacterium]|jgi:predicted alpha/beta superfamily hydrolase|nr:alpha/beta hydrolase-fold protein [Caulobacteraceae bacterium]
METETIERETATATEPVTLPWSTQFDLASKISGRTYRIFVFAPPLPPPEAGYPLLVVLDGNMTFPVAATMGAMYAFSGAPALVVGVGYGASPLEIQVLRFRDLTPPTPAEAVPQRPGIPPLGPEHFGGSAEFRGFLTEELGPAIAAAHQVDPSRAALFGYSLGGLFVLDTLFNQPGAYTRYMAASPSIWWNDSAVLKDEAAFVSRVEGGMPAPRLLISVGDREQMVPSRLPGGMSAGDAEALVAEGRMVDNAWELSTRLSRVTGCGYASCFHAFENEDHLTGMAAAIGRALDFATRD